MKKVIALLLAMSMTVAAFTGCTAGQKASEEKKTETDVATTRFFIMSLFQRDNYQHNNKIPHE